MIKKRNLILLSALLVSSCSISHKRNAEAPEPQAQLAEAPQAEPEKPLSIKKRISDQDLKKSREDQELKKRVVVLPFLDRKGIHDLNVLKNARNAFVDSLNKSGEMIALDPAVLKLSLDKYVKDNSYDMAALAKDAQSAGVSSLLEGRIVDIRFKDEGEEPLTNASYEQTRSVSFDVVVQARMVNIRSGQELFNTVKTVSIDEENSKIPASTTADAFFTRNPELTEILIKEAFLDFNEKLIESLRQIVWEGRIAAFQGDRIYLNVGQISGVQVGDILKVVDDGNEIYDTELGYHVGKVPGRVKGTLEVVGYFGQDGAVSVIHSGAGFKENDRVEVYH